VAHFLALLRKQAKKSLGKQKITAKSVNYESEKPSNPGIYRIPYCFLLSQKAGPVQRYRMELQ
jgi:hypothetical protein